jgi:RND family efflux transporter MFP subunit
LSRPWITSSQSLALATALVLLVPLTTGCGALAARFKASDDDSADDDSAGGSSDDGDDDSAGEPNRVPVRVKIARKGPLESTVSSSATVESVHQVDLITKVSGTVVGLQAEEGDRVQRGQTLARLDNPMQKGERDRAKASLDKAEEDLERLRLLHDKGFISDNEYNEAVHTHGQAKTTYEQAQASLDDTTLRAPFDGTIASRQLELGENVSVGKVAFTVVDLANLEVDIHLPERYLVDLAVGQTARIRSEFTAAEVTGEVIRISPTVDASTGTVKVTVAVRQDQPQLRPGMFVSVDVITAVRDAAILIPKRAVVYEDGEPVAYAVVEGKAVRVRLGPGQEQDDEREVVEGIDQGDQVIVMGQTALKDGALVRIAEE